jgi:hypothetical protein
VLTTGFGVHDALPSAGGAGTALNDIPVQPELTHMSDMTVVGLPQGMVQFISA